MELLHEHIIPFDSYACCRQPVRLACVLIGDEDNAIA